MEEFQNDQAYQCGLTGDYAHMVAALIAEIGLSFQKMYKSLASQRFIQMHTANVKNRFKKYGFRKRPGGRYEVYVDYEASGTGKWQSNKDQLFSGLNIVIW